MVDIRQLHDPLVALGAALHFTARQAPFRTFAAETLVATIDGQIRRRHYLLAFEELKVVGYLGWALLDPAVADRFARTGRPPLDAECRDGQVVWVLTAAASGPSVIRAMIAAGRRLYPGRRVLGMRHRANGRATLLRSATGGSGRLSAPALVGPQAALC